MPEDAARVGDNHTCPTHGGGPILPPCSPNVDTNSVPQARATDKLQCPPAVNFIVTGSQSVEINDLMAARKTDKTMHPPPGEIIVGSENVEIGGPTAGATLGNTKSGKAACEAAAKGRASGSTQQSGPNCSLESPRQIINQAAPPGLNEQQLIDYSNGKYGRPNALPSEQVQILEHYGIDAHQEPSTIGGLGQAVAEGKGVTASLDAANIWGGKTPKGSYHTVMVTGMEYDANGNPVNVIVNDTGRVPPGNCGVSYPVANFEQALKGANYSGGNLVVTDRPIW